MSAGLHVGGVLVRTRPEAISGVRELLTRLPGVEIRAASASQGFLVAVVEQPSDTGLAGILTQMETTAGVLSAALVYHYSDATEGPDEEMAT